MLTFMKEIAGAAGAMALAEWGLFSPDSIKAKSTDKDLVTEVDRNIEQMLIKRIQQRYPEHGIHGEEFGHSGNGNEFCWVLDPIDGTTSYIHQHPFFSVSIGLTRNGQPIAGVVFAPKLDEMFWAESGSGAFLNGRQIHVSTRAKLSESLLATGFACVRAGLTENNLKYFCRLLPEIRGIRRCGSAAIDLSYVACGRYDGYWEMQLQPYDIAAGIIIVREAGGIVTDMHGGDNFPEQGFAASNALIHTELLTHFKG